MTNVARLVLLASSIILSSCGGAKQEESFKDYSTRYLRAQNAYCSSNLLVAQDGMLEFKQWLSTSEHAGEPWYNHELNLVHVNGRLFVLYEFQGETNKAEASYQLSARAYSKYLQSQRLPEQMISKEELRERLALQEKGLDVGWKKSGAASPVTKP